MAKLASLTLADLLTALGKGTATNGWDAVCSYSTDALNAVLAASHARGALATEVKFTLDETDPITGEDFTIAFDLQMQAPTMAFQSGLSGWCTLTMPLQGSYVLTPKGGAPKPGTIAPGYSLVAQVPLAAMYGDGQVAQVGDVVTFSSGATQAQIVVHFKTAAGSGSSYDISPTPPPGDHTILVTYLLPGIEQYFQENVSEIDYALTGLSNAANPAANDDIVIKPQSFVFASDTGVLSLYIQTANSGNPPGNVHPSFQPGGVETIPIPQGYSCSLVLSRQFVQNVYLKPALAQLGTFAFDDTIQPGIGINLYLSAPPLSYNPSHLGWSQLQCDTMVIDYSQLPFQILLLNNLATLNWQYSQNVAWSTDDIDPSGGDIHEDGHTQITVALPTNPSITSALKGISGSDVNVSLAAQASQFQISTDGPSGWFSSGAGIADTLTSYVRSNLPPGISINFGGLNFFLAANLLFPDKQEFFADASVGLNVPNDMLIVGSIGAQPTALGGARRAAAAWSRPGVLYAAVAMVCALAALLFGWPASLLLFAAAAGSALLAARHLATGLGRARPAAPPRSQRAGAPDGAAARVKTTGRRADDRAPRGRKQKSKRRAADRRQR